MPIARAVVTAGMVRAHRMFGLARPRRRLPRQQPPLSVEREYQRELVALVVPRIRAALAPLYADLPALLERAAAERRHDGVRTDAGESRRVRQMVEAARQKIRTSISTSEIEALAEKFARRTATYQRLQLSRQTSAALGVDVVAADRRLSPLIDAFVDANVGLVKDIGEKVASKVELEVSRAVQHGELHGDLAEKLKVIGFGEERAKLIARDQVGKLYGQVNATRQTELGVDRFIWRSVGDERVRDLHDELDGQEFRYSEGGHETEGLPGEPILCRCWAEPVFDDILSEANGPAEEDEIPEEKPARVSLEPTIQEERAPVAQLAQPEPAPIAQPERAPIAAVAELAPVASVAEVAAAAPEIEIAPSQVKNPKRVEAAKKAAEASAERRREIHSAVASNLPQELQVAWASEGHKFMREEAGRIRGIKDRVNAASKLSEAFAEKYGSGEQSVFGNEGDRFQKRAELEAKHAEEWASKQEHDYYEAERRRMIEAGEIDEDGNALGQTEPSYQWDPPAATSDEDPPF